MAFAVKVFMFFFCVDDSKFSPPFFSACSKSRMICRKCGKYIKSVELHQFYINEIHKINLFLLLHDDNVTLSIIDIVFGWLATSYMWREENVFFCFFFMKRNCYLYIYVASTEKWCETFMHAISIFQRHCKKCRSSLHKYDADSVSYEIGCVQFSSHIKMNGTQ